MSVTRAFELTSFHAKNNWSIAAYVSRRQSLLVRSMQILKGWREIVNEYERWQDCFSGQDYAFGKEPNYFLKSCKQLLPRSGRALAVADGEGRNGVWLAEQGLDVLSIDFSPLAQAKARALAIEMGVSVNFEIADVHRWNYPEAEFDVVVEIFTQFSSPNERRAKWTGMRQTLKPGGLLILKGTRPSRLNMPRVDRSEIPKSIYSRNA